jgi:glycerol-3-phosphate dehydrogenase (NAD(P)+)
MGKICGKFALLGAGAWPTALAIQWVRVNNNPVTLWAATEQQAQSINTLKINPRLPNIRIPDEIVYSHDLDNIIRAHDLICIAVPSHYFRETIQRIKPLFKQKRIVWATKGLDNLQHQWFDELIATQLSPEIQTAILSGPSFAREVALDIPTAVVIASSHLSFAEELKWAFQSDHFLIQLTDDIIGVELGGAVKNILAIALGIVDGLGLGANTRAALMTLGFSEMRILGDALGACEETLLGLSGLGDLILTGTEDQSRNRRLGLALGKGLNLAQAKKEIASVIEGIETCASVLYWIQKYSINAPICDMVYRILYQDFPAERLLDCLKRYIT